MRSAGRRAPSKAQSRVKALLAQAGGPLKPYELIERFCQEGGRTHPPTVYRALEQLQDRGEVRRVLTLNAYVLCRCKPDPLSAPLAVCEDCRTVTEIEPIDVGPMLQTLAAHGFSPSGSAIEIRGRCPSCAADARGR